MVEVEKDYARKGTAGAGLGLGIAGTALGLLNGGIPNLLGGWGGWNNFFTSTIPNSRGNNNFASYYRKLEPLTNKALAETIAKFTSVDA